MVRHVAPPTPQQLESARELIARYLRPTPTVYATVRGREIRLKLEGLQVTGSFKVRGALSAVSAAYRDDPSGAVVTSSAGNHGLGVAYAATMLGVPATVVVPANASAAKVQKLRQFDVELVQVGSSYDDAQAYAMEMAERHSIRYISPFNDTDVIAGQATVFLEMIDQAPELEHLVVPVGGGGLMAGTILARDLVGRQDVRLTGVQPEESAALYHVLRGTPMDEVVHHPTIADGLAGGGDEGAITNELVERYGIPLVLVPEVGIRHGVREAAEALGLVLEGSATTALAAITSNVVADEDSRIGMLATGRNIARDLLIELLGTM
ncbi:MAG: threonine ammonia-lyase [Acidimicrobiales bacterium]